MENKNTLYSEKIFQKTTHIIFQYRYVILGSFVIGILAYIYAFTNKLPNHDELVGMFHKGTTFASGRWGLHYMSYIFPDVSMPWVYGILSLFFITIGNCLIVSIFRIKSPLLQFLLGGIIISFPSQIGTFGYMFAACAYSVSFSLSITSAYFICRERQNYIGAAVCLIISLGIYQAYLSVTVSILILFLIYKILTSEQSTKSLFFDGIKYVCFLIASLAIYWIVSQIMWVSTGTEIGEYANSAITVSVASIIRGIQIAYFFFRINLFDCYNMLITTPLSQVVHWLCLILAGIEFVLFVLRRKDWKRSALLLFLLGILPLGINCVSLIISEIYLHTIVFYSFVILYVLFVVLIEYGQCQKIKSAFFNKCHMVLLEGIVLGMLIIMMSNVYIANESYLNMHLSYENTYSVSTSIITQLQNTPGYTVDSKVAMLGTYDRPDIFKTQFADVSAIMGVNGISLNTYSIDYFFRNYLGTNLTWASEEERASISQSPEFADMQAYPNYGFIKQIDGIFVIKLSEM